MSKKYVGVLIVLLFLFICGFVMIWSENHIYPEYLNGLSLGIINHQHKCVDFDILETNFIGEDKTLNISIHSWIKDPEDNYSCEYPFRLSLYLNDAINYSVNPSDKLIINSNESDKLTIEIDKNKTSLGDSLNFSISAKVKHPFYSMYSLNSQGVKLGTFNVILDDEFNGVICEADCFKPIQGKLNDFLLIKGKIKQFFINEEEEHVLIESSPKYKWTVILQRLSEALFIGIIAGLVVEFLKLGKTAQTKRNT